MKNLIRGNLLLIFLIVLSSSYVNAQQSKKLFHITPQVGLRFYNWVENLESGKQLLEEDGPLYQVGISAKLKFGKKVDVYLRADGAVYFGVVDYDGSLQDGLGNLTPYKSETAYFGGELTLNGGYDIYFDKKYTVSPEFGFQYEYWKRDIDNGGKLGYDEFYDVFFIDFGGSFSVDVSRTASVFLRVLGEYPISVSESINLADRGQGGPSDVNLEPESNFGYNLELGAMVSQVMFSIGYDYLLFSKSESDQGYHQPESERTIVKLKVGYSF